MSSASAPIPGVVLINKHAGLVMAFVNGVLVQERKTDQPNQVFVFHPAPDQHIFMTLKETGRVICVDGGKNEDCASIVEANKSGANHEQWKLEDAGDGWVYFAARHSDKVIDVPGATKEVGKGLIQYESNGGDNQKWRIEVVATVQSENPDLVVAPSSQPAQPGPAPTAAPVYVAPPQQQQQTPVYVQPAQPAQQRVFVIPEEYSQHLHRNHKHHHHHHRE